MIQDAINIVVFSMIQHVMPSLLESNM